MPGAIAIPLRACIAAAASAALVIAPRMLAMITASDVMVTGVQLTPGWLEDTIEPPELG